MTAAHTSGSSGWPGSSGGSSNHGGCADCGNATSLHRCDAGAVGCHDGGCHGGEQGTNAAGDAWETEAARAVTLPAIEQPK